jgi:hypothetical protein
MEEMIETEWRLCRVCHNQRIEPWELACDECAERNRRFENETWEAERAMERAADDQRRERIGQRGEQGRARAAGSAAAQGGAG